MCGLMCTWIHESDAELICVWWFFLFVCLFVCLFVFLRCFNILCYASGFYMLLFFRKMFLMRARARVCVCVCVCVCVVHWHCTAQLSMFNMEKRFRNKIIIIIIIIINIYIYKKKRLNKLFIRYTQIFGPAAFLGGAKTD